MSLTVTTKIALWTGGTKLRGANIWVSRSYSGKEAAIGSVAVGPAYSQSDFDRLAQLGANYVNISHAGLFTESVPFTVDTDAQSRLDGILDMVGKANMFAVICFRSGPGRSEFTFHRDAVGSYFTAADLVETVWTTQANQDAWAEMWSYTAQRYKNNPVVVGYDLMVEPNGDALASSTGQPADFYPSRANSLYDWNRFYPGIVVAIRAVDTKTPILIQPMGYGAVAWLPHLQKSSADRIVYAIHQYEPQANYTHQSPAGTNSYPGTYDAMGTGVAVNFNKQWIDNLLKTVDTFAADGSPVVVNEFGAQRWVPAAATYVGDSMALFEQRGWDHAIWEWASSQLVVNWAGSDAADFDAFNFMHGATSTIHTVVPGSSFITSLTNDWSQNSLRPSNVTFSE